MLIMTLPLLWLLLFARQTGEAFSPRQVVSSSRALQQQQQQLFSIVSRLFASPFSNNDKSSESDFTGFNPFSYQTDTSDPTQSVLNNYAGTQISLRKTAMQALMNELLDAVHDPDQQRVPQILQANRDFLIEPLQDFETVLDADSVYTAAMTRAERYQAYQTVMQERLATAKNPAVRTVVSALLEFVMTCE